MGDNTISELSLSEVSPEETPELIAVRETLSQAEQQQGEAGAMLEQRRAELNARAATVKALRESVQAGDMKAAERAPVEYRELQDMEQEVSDFQRVATARRQAVRAAELRVTLAEAFAGIGHMADGDEQARFTAEVGHAIKLILMPALRQAQESDQNTNRAIDRINAHKREWQAWAAEERGRGKLDDWASLSLLGSEHSPDGFMYRDQWFNSRAASRLEQALKGAWSSAVAELRQEKEQAREQVQQG